MSTGSGTIRFERIVFKGVRDLLGDAQTSLSQNGFEPILSSVSWRRYACAQLETCRPHHTRSGPAESAILVNLGGPGAGTTIDRDYFQFLFANNLDVHDLLLVDDRGCGLSGAIDCPELQHGTAPFAQSEIDCAAQLGDAVSRYGTGDIAQDMEALREALGYERVDYLGASWGGVDAISEECL